MKHLPKPTLTKIGLAVMFLAIFLPLSLTAANSGMPTNLHPAAAQMAIEAPTETIRLVVQKADLTEEALTLANRLGGEVVRELKFLNAFVVEMPAGQVPMLARSSHVSWVSVDGQISTAKKPTPAEPVDPPDEPTDPADEAYYRSYFRDTGAFNLVQQFFNLTGEGVGVAVIDSGIDETHPCLNVVVAPFGSGDEYGHGTHVAGIISCKDSSTYTDKLDFNTLFDYRGVAPNVDLISLKIFDVNGLAYESDVVAALEWVYNNKDAYNIRVVNMSFNSTVESSYHESFMNAAAELLWFNGVVVVTSVGNKGPAGGYNTTKTAPANDPFFIAVGASDEHENSDRSNDTYAPFSSAGLTLDGHSKPDIVTPGYNIISALSRFSDWDIQYPERVVGEEYIRLSGTSMAAPIVSGGVAVLLQHMPELTPDQVKYLFTQASTPIMVDGNTSYAYLDTWGILVAALKWDSIPAANTGEIMNKLLFTGDSNAWDPSVAWNSVAWNSVAWNSVAWNSVAWNSVAWNSVAWNSVAWNSVELNGVFWGPTRGSKK